MPTLGQFFKKYTGPLRQLKAVYVLNNLLNREKLQHNKSLYKKHGIRRSIVQAIGSHTFPPEMPWQCPWLDQENAGQVLKKSPTFNTFPPSDQKELHRFVDEGYMILKGFFDQESVDRHNAEINALRSQQQVDFNYTGRKIMDAFRQSEFIDQQFFRNSRLLKLLNFVMGKDVIPFQTINFIAGSEQRAHSDSIHMTTYPKGYLIAIWVALEDCTSENGPLFYFPGSHRLPYIMCDQYPSGNTFFTIGAHSNQQYEDRIQTLIEEHQLKPVQFEAKKGDVLVWHANLLHGGSPIKKEGATRKSMVAHYFCKNVICYHEISQRPALLELSDS